MHAQLKQGAPSRCLDQELGNKQTYDVSALFSSWFRPRNNFFILEFASFRICFPHILANKAKIDWGPCSATSDYMYTYLLNYIAQQDANLAWQRIDIRAVQAIPSLVFKRWVFTGCHNPSIFAKVLQIICISVLAPCPTQIRNMVSLYIYRPQLVGYKNLHTET